MCQFTSITINSTNTLEKFIKTFSRSKYWLGCDTLQEMIRNLQNYILIQLIGYFLVNDLQNKPYQVIC